MAAGIDSVNYASGAAQFFFGVNRTTLIENEPTLFENSPRTSAIGSLS
jgi:hypothetical protein